MIEPYLEDLENRIDPEFEEELLAGWQAFLDGEWDGSIFSPRRRKSSPASIPWPEVSVNQALANPEQMALQQLSGCSNTLAQGNGDIMNVRANYGTGILSSVFGAEIFQMDDELNTLPTTRPLDGGVDAIQSLLDKKAPSLTTGYGGPCLNMGRRLVDLLADYPKAKKYVHVYHPDLQGPMDISELLWGSGLFIELVDNPGLVKALLDRVTDTYIAFMRQWDQIVPPGTSGYTAHWGLLQKGQVMIRDDSAMNLSPEMFDEFIQPYDQRLLSELGEGAIHFCGRGDHYIDRLAGMNGLHAVAMSQPACNDMERIFRHTVDKGIALLGLPRNAAEAALNRGRDLHGRVHCR